MSKFVGLFMVLSISSLSTATTTHHDTSIESDESFVNLHVVDDICPDMTSANSSSSSDSTLPSGSICEFKSDIHCSLDDQCKIGSKCCPTSSDGCNRMCIDLKDGTLSRPKVTIVSQMKKQRRKRQSYGCVACSCVHNCRSDRDCRRSGRRKRCYKNSCSSYCTH